jgi:hypothetical protein
MMAGREFRNDAAERLMRGDLGSDLARKQVAPAQDRDRGFIAGSFDGEDQRFHSLAREEKE